MANFDKLRKQRDELPDISEMYDENGDIKVFEQALDKVIESNEDYANTAQNVFTPEQRTSKVRQIAKDIKTKVRDVDVQQLADLGDINFEFSGANPRRLLTNDKFPIADTPLNSAVIKKMKTKHTSVNHAIDTVASVPSRLSNMITHDYIGNVRYKKKVFSDEYLQQTDMNSFMKMRFIYEPIKQAINNPNAPVGARALEVGLTLVGAAFVPGVGKSIMMDCKKIDPIHRAMLKKPKDPAWYRPISTLLYPITMTAHRHVEAKDAAKGYYTIHSAAMTQTALAMDASIRMKNNPSEAQAIYAEFTNNLGSLRRTFEAQKLPLKAVDAEQASIVAKMLQRDPRARYLFNETYNGEVAPMCDITGEYAFTKRGVKPLYNNNFTLGRVVRDHNDKVTFVTQNGKPVFDLDGERKMVREVYHAPLTPCYDMTDEKKVEKERERIDTKNAILGNAIASGNFYVMDGAHPVKYEDLTQSQRDIFDHTHSIKSAKKSDLLNEFEDADASVRTSQKLNAAFRVIEDNLKEYGRLGDQYNAINKQINEAKQESQFQSIQQTVTVRELNKEREKVIERMVEIHKATGYALGVKGKDVKASAAKFSGSLAGGETNPQSEYVYAVTELLDRYNDAQNKRNDAKVKEYAKSVMILYDNLNTTSGRYMLIPEWKEWSTKYSQKFQPSYPQISKEMKHEEMPIGLNDVVIPDDGGDPERAAELLGMRDEEASDYLEKEAGEVQFAYVPEQDLNNIPGSVDDTTPDDGWVNKDEGDGYEHE